MNWCRGFRFSSLWHVRVSGDMRKAAGPVYADNSTLCPARM